MTTTTTTTTRARIPGQEQSLTPVINDFRLQEVGVRSRAHTNARHESRIRAAAVEATDLQAARQEALQDRVAAPRHHIHQASAESAGAAVQLRHAQRARSTRWRRRWRRFLRGSPTGSTDILRNAASDSMGISDLLPIRLSCAFRHPIAADFGTIPAIETAGRPRRSTVPLRSAPLISSFPKSRSLLSILKTVSLS